MFPGSEVVNKILHHIPIEFKQTAVVILMKLILFATKIPHMRFFENFLI